MIGHRELILNRPKIIRQIKEKKGNKKETQLNVDILATQLIARVNKYFESHNIICEISISHIKLLHLDGDTANCVLKCVYCEKAYKNCISNYAQYVLRMHPKETQPAKQPAATTEIQRSNSSVLTAIGNMLR